MHCTPVSACNCVFYPIMQARECEAFLPLSTLITPFSAALNLVSVSETSEAQTQCLITGRRAGCCADNGIGSWDWTVSCVAQFVVRLGALISVNSWLNCDPGSDCVVNLCLKKWKTPIVASFIRYFPL